MIRMLVCIATITLGVFAGSSGAQTVHKTKIELKNAPQAEVYESVDPTVFRASRTGPRRTFDMLVGPNAPGGECRLDPTGGVDQVRLDDGTGLFMGWYPIFYGRFSHVVAGAVGMPFNPTDPQGLVTNRISAGKVTAMLVLDRRGYEDVYFLLRIHSPGGANPTEVTIHYEDQNGNDQSSTFNVNDVGTKVSVFNGTLTTSAMDYTWGAADNPNTPDTLCLDRILGSAEDLGVWRSNEIPIDFSPE